MRALAASLFLALAGCATLPATPPADRVESRAPTDTGDTRIGRGATRLAAPHAGLNGVRALLDAREAFVARYLLALGADRSIDVQTYIWRSDTSGNLLAEALWDAAERGVRVRVLLDDANTSGLDDMIAALDAHPHIEVRLFNPFANRTWRLGDLAVDFGRVNRRMHNKAFVVDNQAAVVGGRNVGDEYLGADTPVAFTDLDVMAIGPVVPEVSSVFDRYWNSASAWPAAALLAPPPQGTLEATRRRWAEHRQRAEAVRYLEAVRKLPLLAQMMAGTLPLDWVAARVVSDDPAKVLQAGGRHGSPLLPALEEAFGNARHELQLVSPYFVPGRGGTDKLLAITARGVEVSVLTNSLAATDVGPVYSGYARYRQELLRGGVRIFELKPAAAPPGTDDDDVRRGSFGGSTGGSSSASLHAKTFAADRSRVFVGSFNIDPRSIALNTEMGLVLESPALAGLLADAFRDTIPRDAYEVRLEGSQVVWMDRTAQGELRHTRTPETGVLRTLWMGLLSLLPIEWLL
ncbi:phospholipase D family protein [Ramlibacter sp. USB13]|uniref:Phospholipase D family protein n=2 Tax=Ramlibacter cellulosilyticus TaxID=2764187 RepID=A0A923MSJ6_9BURK|nr:phospholipase D family protein [Ramlibacter cellulosilyticus]MBC5783824.1 phospholipase D family protein [Ramlibacter cellulosilyticus]